MRLSGFLISAICAVAVCLVSCKKDEPQSAIVTVTPTQEKAGRGNQPVNPAEPRESAQKAPATVKSPVPLDKLDSFEVILAEPAVDDVGGKAFVYLILYDQEQEMSSADGSIVLTYTIDDANEQHRTKQIQYAMFTQQTIPGEEEPTLCALIDVFQAQPGNTVRVSAKLGELPESEDTITLDGEAADS